MGLARAKRQPYRQTTAIDYRMNFTRQAAACPPHRLALVSCDAGSMLMYTDNGGFDHLDSGIVRLLRRLDQGRERTSASPQSLPKPSRMTFQLDRIHDLDPEFREAGLGF